MLLERPRPRRLFVLLRKLQLFAQVDFLEQRSLRNVFVRLLGNCCPRAADLRGLEGRIIHTWRI